MYVRSLQIHDLRCFREAKLDLQFPGREQEDAPDLPNVNLLLGINGAGKTTVLKAVVLGVLGDTLSFSGFVPYELIRRSLAQGEAEARIEVGLGSKQHGRRMRRRSTRTSPAKR